MKKVEQISIFLENKPGGLEFVTRVLKDAGINIRALSLADTSDFGVLRLIVNDVEKAKQVLKENGFTVGRTSVVAVLVPDRPGGLHSILEALSKEKISLEALAERLAEGGAAGEISQQLREALNSLKESYDGVGDAYGKIAQVTKAFNSAFLTYKEEAYLDKTILDIFQAYMGEEASGQKKE